MNKRNLVYILTLIAAVSAFGYQVFSVEEEQEPWSQEQMLDPAELVEILDGSPKEERPLILAVHPDGMPTLLPEGGGIKGAILFGRTEEDENLDSLEDYLKEVDRDTDIVIYCGCCPIDVCPNVRPAFHLLNQLEFKNHKLLHLSENIRMDWVNKGYPVKKVRP